uniref:Uncharacterized protein n=1 Tax=viral metagenome TaxID=1070528 RepID=A0A6M3M8V9_9ZZZZ
MKISKQTQNLIYCSLILGLLSLFGEPDSLKTKKVLREQKVQIEIMQKQNKDIDKLFKKLKIDTIKDDTIHNIHSRIPDS